MTDQESGRGAAAPAPSPTPDAASSAAPSADADGHTTVAATPPTTATAPPAAVEVEDAAASADPAEPADPLAAAQAEIARLQADLAKERERAEHAIHNWQRAQADFSNYRRRTEGDRPEHVRRATEQFFTAILPVLDDFERAFLSIPPELLRLTWLEGISLIDRKLRYHLSEGHGIEDISAAGVDFDPTQHEAVLSEPVDPDQAGKVLAILQRGYRSPDRVLRPALVKVGVERTGETGKTELS